MSGWIGQRECARCGFTGPETEFVSAGLLGTEVYVVGLADGDPTYEVTLCGGCSQELAARGPEGMEQVVVDLLVERDVRLHRNQCAFCASNAEHGWNPFDLAGKTGKCIGPVYGSGEAS